MLVWAGRGSVRSSNLFTAHLVFSLDEIGLFEGAYKCAMHSISTSVFIGSSLTATQVRHYERPISEGSFGTKSKIFPRLKKRLDKLALALH